LKLLTGMFPPTEGTAWCNGFPLENQIKIRQAIGYCPQFDALHPLLTARETIKLYGMIKGLSRDEIKAATDDMLDRMTLKEYADKQCGTYSGGNKRKLSVAMALIGDPPIVFLDEPSTGMDPVSRRFMWNFISETMNGRSVILTTHSMEECEALCSRIGIMVSGQLTCLGSSQHLKSKFGKGFQIDLRMKNIGDGDRMIGEFGKIFAQAIKMEEHEQTLKLRIVDDKFTLADVFERLNQEKETLEYESFAVQQTSLEQVFIQMAKKDSDENEDGEDKPAGAPALEMQPSSSIVRDNRYSTAQDDSTPQPPTQASRMKIARDRDVE